MFMSMTTCRLIFRTIRADLAGELEDAEAASDGDRLVAVGVHRLRGEKSGGGAP